MNKPVPLPTASGPPAPRRRRADNAFLAPALEILETPPRLSASRWTGSSARWPQRRSPGRIFGRIDIIAIAQGRFQPTGRVKVIEPPETGKVAALHVFNGSRVAASEVLVEFDRSSAEADAMALILVGLGEAEIINQNIRIFTFRRHT